MHTVNLINMVYRTEKKAHILAKIIIGIAHKPTHTSPDLLVLNPRTGQTPLTHGNPGTRGCQYIHYFSLLYSDGQKLFSVSWSFQTPK